MTDTLNLTAIDLNTLISAAPVTDRRSEVHLPVDGSMVILTVTWAQDGSLLSTDVLDTAFRSEVLSQVRALVRAWIEQYAGGLEEEPEYTPHPDDLRGWGEERLSPDHSASFPQEDPDLPF